MKRDIRKPQKATEKKIHTKVAAGSIKPRRKAQEPRRGLFPSGSTLLNLAMSEHVTGGIGAGKIINVVGESSAGKTMLIETAMAEMANDKNYDNVDLYLDDAEQAMEMDIGYLFGKKAKERIMAPDYDENNDPVYSDTIEDFFATIMQKIKESKKTGRPFVYGLDSLDTLSDTAEFDQADDLVKRKEKGSEVILGGSYGMAKAKMMSQTLRVIVSGLAETNSSLIIISQVRDNVNAGYGQPTKRRAGGKALDFYCSHIIWLAAVKAHKAGKAPKSGERDRREIIGRAVEAKISKNKLTGKIRTVNFDIFYDIGLDDIGSCVDFLIDQGWIERHGNVYDASCFGYDGKNIDRQTLLKQIEDDGKVDVLKTCVGKAWARKEDAMRLDRKRRFE